MWGLDAIKTKGESVAIVLHLVGARPVREGTGRIARFELVPLEVSHLEGVGPAQGRLSIPYAEPAASDGMQTCSGYQPIYVLTLCLHSLYMLRQHPARFMQFWLCRSWDTPALPPCDLDGTHRCVVPCCCS